MRFALENNTLIPKPLLEHSSETYPISSIELLPTKVKNPNYMYNRELQQLLVGKQLLLEDIPFPLSTIQEHYVNGYIMYRKGFDNGMCLRCGNKQEYLIAPFPCSRCMEKCMYCRSCIMMGRVSCCSPLVSWIGPDLEFNQPASTLDWSGTLSQGQQDASLKVVQAIEQEKDLLVWAVCGAGKTEVLFKGIERALQMNKRVCIATPRTDVVLELTPRLKAVFPAIPISSLYGGSDDRYISAPLTIATTHQLLRYYQAFDTIILDEVDAFPYSVDESLQYAVKQAQKLLGSTIYLTATPSQKWRKDCLIGKRNYVTIPARFHQYPLPVPTFQWCGNWEKNLQRKNKLPENMLAWIKQRLSDRKPILLFISKIALMEKVLPLLQQIDPAILSVHAEDPLRKEKVHKMRKKEIPLLVTTTILERGVTFSNLDVAVLGAENRIFTESALVQIAGRVGRHAHYPTGDITFFHFGKTSAMVMAKRQIEKMNEEARKKGLIMCDV